ncbi:GntR family transcriptional regulator [uncultured Friedmanniella sp.]|uniref:GntR family transcriptional regulator n=1 Tax=uncultured Friedmanniella sp. TaxID=335381 RepID=UPI0035CA79F8
MSATPLLLRLDPAAPTPVSEQIQTQVVALIRTGALVSGSRLPPVRTLAGDLGVAPNTVAKVYRVLERDGFLTTAGRLGTVVADQGDTATEELRGNVRSALQPLLDRGMTPAEVLRLVRTVLEE